MAQEIEGSGQGPDAAALDAIQANALSQLAAVDAGMQAFEAHRLRLLASLGHLAIERSGGRSSERIAMEMRAVAAEIGVQARVADVTVERQIGDAMTLVDTWPVLLDAFANGRIGRGHVRVTTEAGGVLASSEVTAEQRADFEQRMVALAETTTPARVKKVARREADQHLTEPLVERHKAAREERRLTCEDLDDGMSWIGALVPSVLAHGIQARFRAGAKAKSKDDPRSMQQWQADAFCELLLTGSGQSTIERTPGGTEIEHAGLLAAIKPVVQVQIPVTTLTGTDVQPGSLDGAQPVDAETARILAGAASTWQRLLTDPIRGTVVEVDTYSPTEAQRRLLRARDQHCRFLGCGAKARDDDADHTIAWEDGGTTSLGNLAHLCRRHHTLKHATAWSVSQPTPGTLHWRSPLGHDYVDRPPPVGPRFVEVRANPDVIAPRDDGTWGHDVAPPSDAPF